LCVIRYVYICELIKKRVPYNTDMLCQALIPTKLEYSCTTRATVTCRQHDCKVHKQYGLYYKGKQYTPQYIKTHGFSHIIRTTLDGECFFDALSMSLNYCHMGPITPRGANHHTPYTLRAEFATLWDLFTESLPSYTVNDLREQHKTVLRELKVHHPHATLEDVRTSPFYTPSIQELDAFSRYTYGVCPLFISSDKYRRKNHMSDQYLYMVLYRTRRTFPRFRLVAQFTKAKHMILLFTKADLPVEYTKLRKPRRVRFRTSQLEEVKFF
jgi:hypothetical protein